MIVAIVLGSIGLVGLLLAIWMIYQLSKNIYYHSGMSVIEVDKSHRYKINIVTKK